MDGSLEPNSLKSCQWDLCSHKFEDFEELFRHLKEFHVNSQNPTLPRDCRWANTCNYQTSEKKHLVSHLRSHLDWRPFSCEICGSRFKHEHEIRRHVDKLHMKNTQINEVSPTQIISPPPFNNNSGSLNDSSVKLGSGMSSLSPTAEWSPNNSEGCLYEIIEFALGYRDVIRVDDAMRNQLLSIGLPPVVLDLPRAQLRRLVIESFYQSLIVLTSTPNSTMSQNNYSPGIVYATENFVQHPGMVHTNLVSASGGSGSFSPNHGIAHMPAQFGGGSFIPQQYISLQPNNGYAFTGPSHGVAQAHDYSNMSGYVSQAGFSKPSYEGYTYNPGMCQTNTTIPSGSTCIPATQNYSSFADPNSFHNATEGLPRSVPCFVSEPKKEASATAFPSLETKEETPLSPPTSPPGKYNVHPMFSSIIPNIKNFLKGTSAPPSPKLKPEQSSDSLAEVHSEPPSPNPPCQVELSKAATVASSPLGTEKVLTPPIDEPTKPLEPFNPATVFKKLYSLGNRLTGSKESLVLDETNAHSRDSSTTSANHPLTPGASSVNSINQPPLSPNAGPINAAEKAPQPILTTTKHDALPLTSDEEVVKELDSLKL